MTCAGSLRQFLTCLEILKIIKGNFVVEIVSFHHELIILFVKSYKLYLFGFVIIGSNLIYVVYILALCEETLWDTTVRLSETMTLECVYPLMDNLTQVEWTKNTGTNTVSIAVYNPNHNMHIDPNYLHRVHFLNSTVGFRNMSLSFYNASEADIGTYSCLFHAFPRGPWEKKIKVVWSDSFEIAAPLDSYLSAKPGQNVTLNCQLQRTWPVQQVIWEKVQPHQVDILASCNLSQGTRYTSKYLRQTWSNCSQESMESVLIIPYAMASDSGLYRCRSEASTEKTKTFVIRLIITDGE